jgi:D-3-phosphoglycerate dehydrogenase
VSTSRKVLVTDHPWRSIEPEEELLGAAGAELVFAETGAEDELIGLAADADAILTCFARVTERVVQAAPHLQVIGRYGIGVDNIAVTEATSRGVLVTNTPSYCVDEVVEHALALILDLRRQVSSFNRAVHDGDWSLTSSRPVHRLRGSTLGIVGLGEIGTALALQATALGMTVIAHHPRKDAETVRATGATPVSLDELAASSDVVTLHVPLNAETRHLIGAEFLRSMKSTAYLINVARGGVVDQDALVRALREGWIGGAGLDVVEPERLPPEHPLLALPNAIVTPHVAYYSEESLLDLGRLASENVAAVLGGHMPRSIINPEVLELARWQSLGAGQ